MNLSLYMEMNSRFPQYSETNFADILLVFHLLLQGTLWFHWWGSDRVKAWLLTLLSWVNVWSVVKIIHQYVCCIRIPQFCSWDISWMYNKIPLWGFHKILVIYMKLCPSSTLSIFKLQHKIVTFHSAFCLVKYWQSSQLVSGSDASSTMTSAGLFVERFALAGV